MDSILSLAFSLKDNRGAYAVLLGAGISKNAGMPTGYEVVLDLLAQIRELDPQTTLDETVGYDELLAAMAKTQTERNSILRKYFEPTEEEREQGIKVPSKAHHAIAQLVKDGFIKVVITTNFDRLMEQALEQAGVIPDVIRTDDMLKGARPIRHSDATVIQLHGDYRDVRSLNTPEELRKYSKQKKALLDDIFSEYGLIVCGWSARYDSALRDALFRNPCKWYGTYWIEPYELSPEASDLVNHRRAQVITAAGDDFFTDLAAKVTSLAQFDRVHPLSIEAAVAYVKRLLPYETSRIELEDYLKSEADKVFARIMNSTPDVAQNQAITYENHVQQLRKIYDLIEPLLHILLAICWYDDEGQYASSITSMLNRWTYDDETITYATYRRLAVLLVMYVCGIVATEREHWTYFKAVVVSPVYSRKTHDREAPLVEVIVKQSIFAYESRSIESWYDHISLLLRRQLYLLFTRYFPIETGFTQTFRLFELLLDIISQHKFGRRVPHDLLHEQDSGDPTVKKVMEFWFDGGRQRIDWALLKAFFDGNYEKLRTALETYEDTARKFKNGALVGFREKYDEGYLTGTR